MIIYLCINNESNTLMFKRHQTETIFQLFSMLKKGHNSKLIGEFYPKSSSTYIL